MPLKRPFERHDVPHHLHRRDLRGFGYFKRFGPGIVTGASDDDPSGIGTYSQVGAAFGFGLLWTAVVSPSWSRRRPRWALRASPRWRPLTRLHAH
jgi:hypothetical protein